MSPESTKASRLPVPRASVNARPHGAIAFWQILTHFDSTKVSAHRAFRNAVGVLLPLIAGFALHMPRGGLVVASGALNVSYSDGSDPYSERARRMLASSIICAVAVFAGAISGQHQIFAIVLATLWAFVAGISNALGGAAPDIGVISLVTLLIYAAQPLTPHQAAVSGVLALAGGLLQTSLSIALWPMRRYDPERRALASYYLELADRAAAPLDPASAPLAAIHSEQVQQLLSGLGRDRGPDGMRYRALHDQGERIRLTLLILLRLRLRMQRENPSYPPIDILSRDLQVASQVLRSISNSLSPSTPEQSPEKEKQALEALAQFSTQLRQHEALTSPSFLGAAARDALFQMDALSGQLRAALELSKNDATVDSSSASQTTVQSTWKENLGAKIETLRENLNLQSSSFRHALRLAILVALGDMIGRSVSWQRTYWLPMTIVLVLKPDFTATFSRGLLRIAGSIIGLLLATELFHIFHLSIALQIVLIFAFVFLLRWLGPANYGIFCIVVSGLIVLLLAISGVSPREVIWARGVNTVAGGTLALLAYWLWPTWERTLVSERIAQMLDAYRDYFHALSHLSPGDGFSLRRLELTRRAARVARANLETSVERLSTEPGTTREQLNQLNTVIASSHRFFHAAMALDAIVSQDPAFSNSPPWERFSSSVNRTLALLASALRGARVMPREFPDLREEHRLLFQARSPSTGGSAAPFDSIAIEADRITNSVNTLAEQIMQWVRSPAFARFHKLNLNARTQEG